MSGERTAGEVLRYWTNFGEDGPWAWWWLVVRSGCWRGHDWHEKDETEEAGGAVYVISTYRACSRCGDIRTEQDTA